MPRIYTKSDPVERFWSKVNRNAPGGCWEWTGAKNTWGYGKLSIYEGGVKKFKVASRFSYELHFGRIPDGLFVCHKCDNPSCVNPTHLFVGTQSDNAIDRQRKGRAYIPENKGEKNGRAKLAEHDVIEIRNLRKHKKSQSAIGKIFGISKTLVRNIEKRKLWKHIP